MKRWLNLFTLVTFCFSNFSSSLVFAQTSSLPAPTQILNVSPKYSFPVLSGVKIDPKNPLKITFIIDAADQDNVGKEEAAILIRYFLAGLTIPQEDLWVNLSPYEQNRIIPQGLSETDLGSDMLSQDYFLKQISASLTYPESAIGKKYWDEVNNVGARSPRPGQGNPAPTANFTKVWIMPNSAEVYEHKDTAVIAKASLKVMMEEDYLATQKNVGARSPRPGQGNPAPTGAFKTQILPVIEQEVNTGKNFAQLRQVYRSLVLATWFKKKFQESFYKNYINQKKTNGIDLADKTAKDKVYALYCEAFSKGVYNYVKKEQVSAVKATRRQYFSGGEDCTGLSRIETSTPATDAQVQAEMPKHGLLVETAPAQSGALGEITELGAQLEIASYVQEEDKNHPGMVNRIVAIAVEYPELARQAIAALITTATPNYVYDYDLGLVGIERILAQRKDLASDPDIQTALRMLTSLESTANDQFWQDTDGNRHMKDSPGGAGIMEASEQLRQLAEKISSGAAALARMDNAGEAHLNSDQLSAFRTAIYDAIKGKATELSEELLAKIMAMLPNNAFAMRKAVTEVFEAMMTSDNDYLDKKVVDAACKHYKLNQDEQNALQYLAFPGQGGFSGWGNKFAKARLRYQVNRLGSNSLRGRLGTKNVTTILSIIDKRPNWGRHAINLLENQLTLLSEYRFSVDDILYTIEQIAKKQPDLLGQKEKDLIQKMNVLSEERIELLGVPERIDGENSTADNFNQFPPYIRNPAHEIARDRIWDIDQELTSLAGKIKAEVGQKQASAAEPTSESPKGGIDIRGLKVGVAANSIPVELPGVGQEFFQNYSLKIIRMKKIG